MELAAAAGVGSGFSIGWCWEEEKTRKMAREKEMRKESRQGRYQKKRGRKEYREGKEEKGVDTR